jgi:NhaP-type Na+/H+ or K+/H+ antiporter
MAGMSEPRGWRKRARIGFLCCLAAYAAYTVFVFAVAIYFPDHTRDWTIPMLLCGAGALLIGCVLGAAIGWLLSRFSKSGWRFGVRDLVLIVTLISAALGYVVYSLRK